MSQRTNIHGTGIVVDGVGIILRGPSGAGKSLLALELLDAAEVSGKKTALIADDRLDVTVENDQLIAHAPPEIGGLIELRGRGIVSRPHVASAPMHLVVDLVDELVRLVEEDTLETQIEGVTMACCPVPYRKIVDSAHQKLLVGEALRALKKTT